MSFRHKSAFVSLPNSAIYRKKPVEGVVSRQTESKISWHSNGLSFNDIPYRGGLEGTAHSHNTLAKKKKWQMICSQVANKHNLTSNQGTAKKNSKEI